MVEGADKENEERAVLKGFLLVPAWALVRVSVIHFVVAVY